MIQVENDIVLGETKIQKEFEGHGLYIGTIVSKANDLYTVKYDDGDEEEMPFNELVPLFYYEGGVPPAPVVPPPSEPPVPEAPTPSVPPVLASPQPPTTNQDEGMDDAQRVIAEQNDRKRKADQMASAAKKKKKPAAKPKRSSFDPSKPPKNAKKVQQTGGCVRCSKVLQVKCNEKKPCDWCALDNKKCEYYEGLRPSEVYDVRCPTTVNQEEIDKARIKIRSEGRKRVAGAALRAKLGFPREVVLTKYENMGLLLETDNVAKTINVLDVLDQAPAEVKDKLNKGDFILSLDHILAQNLKDCSLIEEAIAKHHPLGTTMLLTVARMADEREAEEEAPKRTEMLTIKVEKPKSLGLTLIESKTTKTITVHRINNDVATWEVKAKFKVGDQIHTINGRPLPTVAHVVDAMGAVNIGEELNFTVERVLETGSKSSADAGSSQAAVEEEVSLKKEDEMGLELKIEPRTKSLVVMAISDSAPNEVRTKLNVGDAITSLNGMTATNRKDLSFIKDKLLNTFVEGQTMILAVQKASKSKKNSQSAEEKQSDPAAEFEEVQDDEEALDAEEEEEAELEPEEQEDEADADENADGKDPHVPKQSSKQSL